MANVLTDLAADIYVAADKIGRELTGCASSVMLNTGTEQAAIGTTVRSHKTRKATAVDITPAMTIPEGTDQTTDNLTMTLTKQRGVQIPWTGEDIKYVNDGAGYTTIYGDQIAQAMRTVVNEIETDICVEVYKNACRAVGTAGTTPFASNFNLLADLRKIFADNGQPVDDGQWSVVMNTTAGANLRKLATLQKADESGGTDLLRRGTLLDLQGFRLKESAKIQSHTKGTGSGYLIDLVAGYGADDREIHVDTGTGTLLQGDVITIADEGGNNYVINTGFAGDGDGDITLAYPGLVPDTLGAINNKAVTIGNNYAANFALHRSAAEIAIRAPANPIGGDAAVDVMTVQDPNTGLVFEISVYKGFKKAMIMVGAVWGVKAWNQDCIGLLMG
ncbi:MAG: P22 coat - protein 5 family protein [Pseudomonadales bacterium]|nr:P22 coat - protein 5 family protein [Pseudomonadales bacterium]